MLRKYQVRKIQMTNDPMTKRHGSAALQDAAANEHGATQIPRGHVPTRRDCAAFIPLAILELCARI